MLAERINKPLRLKVLRQSGEQHTLQVRTTQRLLFFKVYWVVINPSES